MAVAQMPTTERGRRSRAAIVDAAATMMYERGVTATGIDHILATANCGKSQLYFYFSDKSDLVRAVIARQLEIILAYQQPAINEADTWAGLRRWGDIVIAQHDLDGGPFACPLGSMAAELKTDPTYLPTLQAAFREWERPLAECLERMRHRGKLTRQSDPARLAQSTIAALQGGMLLAKIHDDPVIIRDAVDNALLAIRRKAATATRR